MIASVQGEVIGFGDDSLVIGVSGIGLRVYVTPAVHVQARPGDTLMLHTYLVVREDSLSLFGFSTEAERDFYILMLGVNGVGPRTALSILGTLSVDAMKRAVLSEQPEVFARVSGVGKKTAQKILLHLQGKVDGDISMMKPVSDADAEVLDALIGLGYSVVEAQTALQSLPREPSSDDVEERLRLALKFFSS